MVRLAQIERFGVAEADNDDLLLECFQDHEAYVAAREHQKFLIIGRKGSGKTAIFRKLKSEVQWDQFCYAHSFSDYPWFHHDRQKKSGVPEAECYRYSWEYVILISLAKMIINLDDTPWSENSLQAMAKLEDFVVDTYGSKDPDLTRFFAPDTRIKLKGSIASGWGPVKADVSAERVSIDYLPNIVYEVNRSLLDTLLVCLNPEHSYHVCFDELDRGFVAEDANYKNRLSGLLIAARDINRRIREAGKRASAVVFLRDDILRHLRFEDKNKIVEDFSSTIEWDKSTTTKTLQYLMARRFAKLLNVSEDVAWNIVFNEEQLMAGKQSKYQHVLGRTLKRPRDIIKFCNEVLRSYKQNKRTNEKFENLDIVSARDEYSRYLKKELDDEMHQHFPLADEGFEMLKAIGYQSFTLGAFDKSFALIEPRAKTGKVASFFLKQLYNFSAIGYLKVGGAGGGSEWVWRYEDTEAEYDDRATVFRVHSGLKEVLELKQGRATEGEAVPPAAEELEEV